MYTSNAALFKLDPAKSGAQMHLNGGKAVLSKLIRTAMTKERLTIGQFSKKARVCHGLVAKLLRHQQDGVRLNKLHAIVQAAGGETKTVMQRIAHTNKGPTPQKRAKPHTSKQLKQLISTLGIGAPELAAAITIGEDRITVERLPGQENQPVVVEHNGHRLTIAKV